MDHNIKNHYKFVVIGAGAGGLTAAIRFAKKKADCLLVSKTIGGICTNTGCIPSKALLKIAGDYYKSDNAEIKENIKQNVFKYVQHAINEVKLEETEAMTKYKVNYAKGDASFISKNKLFIEFPDHKTHEVTFEKAIIATGSTPNCIDIPGVEESKILTSNTVFYLSELPKSLVIIGGGHIAAEVATALGKLGTQVIVTARSTFLEREPKSISNHVRNSLEKLGVQIIEDVSSSRYDYAKHKFIITHSDNSEVEFDEPGAYLIAIGRVPNTDDLNLEAAGVKYDKAGIKIDNNYLTTNPNIFAIGDCAMGTNFTATAENQAKFAVKKCLFPYVNKELTALPVVVFTDPLISSVGILEESNNIQKFKIDFARSHKALIDDESVMEGEFYVNKYTARIVGASIVGSFAEHIINFFTLAIHKKMTVYDLEDFLIPYPTYFYEIFDLYDQFVKKNKFNFISRLLKFYFENVFGVWISAMLMLILISLIVYMLLPIQ